MSKAQDFLKMNEAGKGGKGKKLSATVIDLSEPVL